MSNLEIKQVYSSKLYIHKYSKKAILMIIMDAETQHYLVITKLHTFLRDITSNDNGEFFFLLLFSFKISSKSKIGFIPFFVSVLENASKCENNPEDSHSIEINRYTACGLSIFIRFTHDKAKSKRYFYSESDCMSKLWKILKNLLKN